MSRVSTVAAWTVIALGTISVITYIWGVVQVFGESDQSWMFWGAIFLLLGIAMIRFGARLLTRPH